MQTVTAADGTEIAYERHGSGPPLVALHGGSGSKEHWEPLVPHLAEAFTVVAVDRRGRGDSGDVPERTSTGRSEAGDPDAGYSLDREVEDLRAVVEAVDGDPTVLGHSFGGLVALAAAAEIPAERLVLYEPAVLTGDHREGADLAARMQSRLDDGRRRDALELFYRGAGGIDDPDALPFWPEDAPVDLVETIVRENRAVERFDVAEAEVPVPTLLVTGEHGPEHLRDGVRTLDRTLPDSRVVELDGVGHVGTTAAPERLADAIRTFVEEP